MVDRDVFIKRCLRYLDGLMDSAEVKTFDHELACDAEKRRKLSELCYGIGLIREAASERLTENQSPADIGNSSALILDDDQVEEILVPDKCIDSSLIFEALKIDVHANSKREALKAAARCDAEQQAKAERAERLKRQRMLAGQYDFDTTPVRHIVIPKAVLYGGVATIAAMLLMMILPMFESKSVVKAPMDEPAAAPTPQFVQVATLIEQINAKWLGGSHDLTTNPSLLNEQIHLVSGLAKIRFNNQAEVILEAPCSIEPVSDKEMKIIFGKLVGRCETNRSRGFVVQTPGARIIDLGTEFGVSVDKQGAAQAHVFEGEIELTTASITSPIKIQRNQARQVDVTGGRVSSIETNEFVFVRGEEFEANAKADQSPYHRWLAHSYKLRRDPSLAAYYTFDNQSESPNQLLNRAAATRGELDGQLGDGVDRTKTPSWSAGRWSDKSALRFDHRRHDHVTVAHNDHLNLRELTIALWVKPTDPRRTAHLINKAYSHRPHFNFAWDAAHPEHPMSPAFLRGAGQSRPDNVLPRQSRWTFLAVTCDSSGRVVYFVDERRVAIGNIGLETFVSDADMVIGDRGWMDPNDHLYPPDDAFDGLMDELAIFNKVLSEQDIREMYKAGKP